MKIKLLLISFILAANALGAVAQVSKTYFVSKPGTLISMMTEDEANSITHLTLTGKINAEDFRHLRDEFIGHFECRHQDVHRESRYLSQRKTLRLYAELHPYLRFLEHRRRSD